MIGNPSTAEYVLDYHYSGVQIKHYLPKYLDEGCTRAVYIVNNVVYKIEVDSLGYDNKHTNRAEYSNYLKHKRTLNRYRTLRDWKITPSSLHQVGNNDVLAMPYVRGIMHDCDGYCKCERINEILGLDDIYLGNIIDKRDRTHWIVDYAA